MEFQAAFRDVQDIIMARSSAGKLARLILSWTAGQDGNEVRVRSTFTHEEMAQMIGTSRETVTRLLSDLKRRELIKLEGSTMVIRNRPALEALLA
jgi:CRP/FNR family transcriptional regulator